MDETSDGIMGEISVSRRETLHSSCPLHLCVCVSSLPGERSEMVQDRLPLIVGSALGGLAFLVIAAIAILAIIFKR